MKAILALAVVTVALLGCGSQPQAPGGTYRASWPAEPRCRDARVPAWAAREV